MKTLYIDIDEDDIVSPSEDIEVYSYNLIHDFFSFIGEKIAREYAEEDINLIRLMADYEKESGSTPFTEQWDELKALLFGDEPQGRYTLSLPMEYLSWLRLHTDDVYCSIYNRYYKGMQSVELIVDIKELYDDVIEPLLDEVCRYLDRNADKGFTLLGFNENIAKESFLRIKEKYNLIFSPFFISNLRKAGPFHNGLALIEKDSKVGYINHRGKIIIPMEYNEAHMENHAIIVKKNGKWGVLNKLGNVIIPFLYDELAFQYEYSCYKGKRGNRIWYLDKEGSFGHLSENGRFYQADLYSDHVVDIGLDILWGASNCGSHTIKTIRAGELDCEETIPERIKELRPEKGWRLPTEAEIKQLFSCSFERCEEGCRITDSNGESIFFPYGYYAVKCLDKKYYTLHVTKEAVYESPYWEPNRQIYVRLVYDLSL